MITLPEVIINWILLVTIGAHATYITSDPLQQVYVIRDQGTLVKYDSTGKILFTYNQNRYGTLRAIDASNPMKVICSYSDFGTVVMLDNTLSEVGVTSLKLLGISNYRTLCFSPRDNNFWVYDEDTYKLKKVDRNGNIILESTDMMLQIGEIIHPVFMQEENDLLFASDTAKGILVFDTYGVYYETLPFKGVQKFQVRGDRIYFPERNFLHSYQLLTLEEKLIRLPDIDGLQDVRIENNRLFVSTTKGDLEIYRY
jgi:hypothetical protein